jgi:hypothetical protein
MLQKSNSLAPLGRTATQREHLELCEGRHRLCRRWRRRQRLACVEPRRLAKHVIPRAPERLAHDVRGAIGKRRRRGPRAGRRRRVVHRAERALEPGQDACAEEARLGVDPVEGLRDGLDEVVAAGRGSSGRRGLLTRGAGRLRASVRRLLARARWAGDARRLARALRPLRGREGELAAHTPASRVYTHPAGRHAWNAGLSAVCGMYIWGAHQ